MENVEPKIRPLVDALNQTGLVRTFSSCEGHFALEEQTIVDRNHAEVRFVPAPDTSIIAVEKLLASILLRFKSKHGLIPVKLTGYKLLTPIDEKTVEETFVLELRPFNRFDPPDRKRSDVDRAIEQTVKLTYEV
ncbi:hypothetical protein IC229_29310 [Spirosoma sp. BT702]|uniref:Uncharacterized protein n=1 Tax=Spirosoma profusum TaxID=2771354 RepID=A0A927G9Y6_9BACT|nr:hypothetical protein [Spirosoma profusum]MBD2704769.1 hypothetical protein [Spirosoma profusum]